MSVDGVSVVVRTEMIHYSMSAGDTSSTRPYNVAKFTVSGAAAVSIRSLQAITTYSVTPAALNVPSSVSGDTITLNLSGPQNLVIKIAGQPDLLLIATPPEQEVYTASGSGVVYFGPGIHVAGVINCASDTTYYLAPGALVKGVFNIIGAHNVRIIGRGLIDGAVDSKDIAAQTVIYANNASRVKIEGVGVRHANGWQSLYYNSDHIDISYVNMLGGVVVNRDGIDLDGVEDATIRNSLIYAGDDGFGWHAVGSGSAPIGTVPNFPMARILADNNVIYNDVGGNVVRLGSSFETDYVRDITIRNLYGLYWHESGFRSDMSDYANLRNIVLENWYLSPNLYNSISVVVGPTSYSNTKPTYMPGSIDGLLFRNFNAVRTGFTLNGFDATHQISNVGVEKVTLGGTLVTSPSQIAGRAFTSGITFSSTLLAHPQPTAGVIDNGGPGFTTTGSWQSSALAGFNGSSTIYSNANGSTASWSPTLDAAGYYTVYVTYPHADNSTRRVNYTVTYPGGSKVVAVDQSGLADIWQSLGTFKFAAGTTGRVTLTAQGRSRADAVRFERAYIVDDDDSGFSKSGNWATSLSGFNDTPTFSAQSANATATWTPNLPAAGRYAVYVWFPVDPASDPAARYDVNGSTGTQSVTISQRKYAGKWRSLGIFNFAAGNVGSVRLTTSTAGGRADAAYFVRIP